MWIQSNSIVKIPEKRKRFQEIYDVVLNVQ